MTSNTFAVDPIALRLRSNLDRLTSIIASKNCSVDEVNYHCVFTGKKLILDKQTINKINYLTLKLLKYKDENTSLSNNYIHFKKKYMSDDRIHKNHLNEYEIFLTKTLSNLKQINKCITDIVYYYPNTLANYKKFLNEICLNDLIFLLHNCENRLNFLKESRNKIRKYPYEYELFDRMYGFINGTLNIKKLKNFF